MANISNLNLTLIPLANSVAAVLTYQINWEPGDAGQLFAPNVALRGQDPLMDDDLAPMNASPALIPGQPPLAPPTFAFAVNVVPRSTANEDKDLNLIVAAITNKDEIYGRVKLTSVFSGTELSADTNVVTGDFGP